MKYSKIYLFALIICSIISLYPRPANAFLFFFAAKKLYDLIDTEYDSSSESVENISFSYDGRDMYLHIPENLPNEGSRSMVVVLHGYMGNAESISKKQNEAAMNLDEVADKYGFIVVYMNGSPATKYISDNKKGWNAGECCGQSVEGRVDDIGYIRGAIETLVNKYGIDNSHIYGVGYSNGAMMTQLVMCEAGIYAAGVSISGTLEMETSYCRLAQGRKILEIHGENDTSVPIAGGVGSGISGQYIRSQDYSKSIFNNSGAQYILQVLPGAEHKMDTIEDAVEKREGKTLPEKISQFFGLAH